MSKLLVALALALTLGACVKTISDVGVVVGDLAPVACAAFKSPITAQTCLNSAGIAIPAGEAIAQGLVPANKR